MAPACSRTSSAAGRAPCVVVAGMANGASNRLALRSNAPAGRNSSQLSRVPASKPSSMFPSAKMRVSGRPSEACLKEIAAFEEVLHVDIVALPNLA